MPVTQNQKRQDHKDKTREEMITALLLFLQLYFKGLFANIVGCENGSWKTKTLKAFNTVWREYFCPNPLPHKTPLIPHCTKWSPEEQLVLTAPSAGSLCHCTEPMPHPLVAAFLSTLYALLAQL